MSLNQDQVERRYEPDTNRLFLVYYPIIPGYNGNKWGVSENSLHTNIQTAINKPVVVYRKNPTNHYHTHQAGNFVHPTIEEAAAEIGHPPNAEEYYNWQERFAIGRVRNVDKRGEKGYAFTLEITDPDAKTILKSDRYSTGIPGWTSPQIISNARLYPEEEASGIFNHWTISHIALVDIPAYGVEQSALRGRCLGAEKECMIQTKSASQENLGFCVRQATMDLVNAFSNSSQSAQSSESNHTIMSTSENTAPKSSETVTYVATTPQTDNTNPIAITGETEKKPQGQEPPEKNPPPSVEPEPTTKEPLAGAKTLDEANAQIRQMSELLQETNKQLKAQQKELDRITLSERRARLAFIIPRDLFKSDKSHADEVEKTLNEKMSESWLIDYWKTKRELAMVNQGVKRSEEQPIVAKSASLEQHEVPDFSSSQNQSQRSNIQKLMDLQNMILDGGSR